MQINDFVQMLCSLTFENVFNPYSNKCDLYDLPDAPNRRTSVLLSILQAASNSEVDAIWIGRDLGYRGGRRTGLALTDDVHIAEHAARWGIKTDRPTSGEPVVERTAAIIWSVLEEVSVPVFLWNVFPLHPHESGKPFSNRSHNAKERHVGEALLAELITILKPRRLIAIGNDAAKASHRLRGTIDVNKVRHPSYGGQTQFLEEMWALYGLRFPKMF
jgi:hypothetical protein